ncbi:MAG: hypothetical protein FJ297_03790 [Planctomycetes bacterium]|nr:hypothetical protein [Planctomycetota bacterium]
MAWLDYGLRFAHILGAILLVGGIVFQRCVAVPALDPARDPTSGPDADRSRQRWGRLILAGIALLLVSGLVQTALVSIAYRFPNGEYNPVLGVKILAALAIMFVASVLAGRSPVSRKWQRAPRRWLNLLVVLSVTVLLLAGIMRKAERVPKKSDAANEPTWGVTMR